LPEIVEQTPPQKSQKKILQRTMKILIFIVMFFIFLIVFVGAFTQTSWFLNIVRSQIENLVKKNINGKLNLGRIEGNFISGFTVYDAHLKLNGSDTTEIISMNELYARYSIWKFISGSEIPITTIVFRSPSIRLIKLSGDSLWNYERLLPSENSKGPSSPFNLTIDVQNLRIENGKLFVRDYNTSLKNASVKSLHDSSIDWSNVELQNVNLDMRAYIQGEKNQRVQINNLSFIKSGNNPFSLHHLEFGAYHNDLYVEVTNLHLISDGSDIRLTALFNPLQVLNGKPLDSLEHSQTKLILSASAVNEKELKYFLPDLTFLDGSPSLNIDAEGEFGKLKILKGKLGFRDRGDISFSGELRNLHHPQNLYLDVALIAHSLSDRTLRRYVPGLNIADIQSFGTINIEKLTFTGYTNNFISNFDIHSTSGTVNGKASFDLRSAQMNYDADISTKNVDLAVLLRDPTIKSDLNSSFKIKGKGTNPKTMQAEFSLDGAGTTAFKNYQIEKFHVGGKIGGAELVLENTEVILNSGASLKSQYATVNFSEKIPTYDLDVATKDLPVSDFAPIFPNSSKVSVEANLSGSGLSANNLVGSIGAEISGLEQDRKPLPNIILDATLARDPADQHRRIDIITSSIADLTFKGKYNIETIGNILGERIQKISGAIRNRSKDVTDTLNIFGENSLFCSDSIDLSYTANIKDLRPFAPFIPNVVLLGSGKLNGSVIGCENGQIAIATQGNVHNFLLRQRKGIDSIAIPSIRLKDTKFSFSVEHIANNENLIMRSLKSEFSMNSDSIIKFNGMPIEKPDVTISLNGGGLNYSVNAILPNKLGIYLSGIGNISNPDLTFQPDSLRLAFGKSFAWHNDSKPHITIGADGSIEMDTLSLIEPKLGYDPELKFAQRIKLGFKIKGDSILYAYVTIPQLDLADVSKFLPDSSSTPELNNINGRVSNMNVFMEGSFSHPQISAKLALRNITYNNKLNDYNKVTIDSGRINLLYKDLTFSGNAVFHVDTAAFSIDNILQGRENFIANGDNSFHLYIDSIPYLFSLNKYSGYSADSASIVKREMSIRASGKDFPLDMFSPFVPVVANLHGLADIELTINGSSENILYKGSVNIAKGSLLLPMTNLYYNINGKLLFSNEEMRFIDMNIANMASDDPDGHGVLNGSFFFKGFLVQSFKLSLETDRLKILSDASKETLKSIYGPLTIRTQGEPLTFSGTFDKPMLAGNIEIVEGSLTIPQSEVSSVELNDGITYRIKKEDTLPDTMQNNILSDSLKHIIQTIAESENIKEYNDTAFEKAVQNATPSAISETEFTSEQLSFQDKMLYDLRISVPGNLWFNINLSKLYGVVKQQLTAEIKTDGAFSFKRDEAGGKYIPDGIITVTNKSSYTFIKEFSPVTGTISFVKSLDDPTIDITAEYTGQHRTPGGTDETIKIKLIIQGTPSEPRLTMELYHKNNQGDFSKDYRPQDQVQADVLTYLTTGNFASDTPGQNSNNGFANAGYSVGSGIVSSAFTNLVKSKYIRGIGFVYGGNLASKLNLSLGYKDVTFNVGGAINSGSTSSDFSIDVPFSTVFTFQDANKFLLRGESHLGTDPFAQTLAQQPLFLGRLLYRYSP